MSDVQFQESRELKERVVEINRVAKVVKGGRRFSFTALVVIGDEHDRVGVGYGKAREVPLAITKAVDDAKKNLFTRAEARHDDHARVIGKFDAARVMLRPASEGTGVIAGGGVRAVLELAGIRDILAKSLGTTNPINMAKATVNALQSLRRPEDVARARGKTIAEVLPYRSTGAEAAEGSGRAAAAGAAERPIEAERPSGACRAAVAEEAAAEPAPRSTVADDEATKPLMTKVKITQTRSQIGQSQRHRGTLRALGLGKIGSAVEKPESPVLAGMLRKVRHLVQVEEV